jgi:ComF family protein
LEAVERGVLVDSPARSIAPDNKVKRVMAVAATAQPESVRRRSWRYQARQVAWAGVDFLFPPRCAGCQAPGARLCAACQVAILPLELPQCSLCGYPLGGAPQCSACWSGQRSVAPLAGLRSWAYFEGPLRSALHQFKYKRDIILADTLGALLAVGVAGSLPAGLVVPVPLSANRLRERGYNQAELLARAFAELCGLPLDPRAAARQRDTASQVGLSPTQRRANVHGAFAADARRVGGRTVVLVDDVCTTGATLAACAAALRAAGAAAVWGLTLARARLPGRNRGGASD